MKNHGMQGLLLATVTGVLVATQAVAMFPPDSKDKLKCTQAVSKELTKFVGKKQKCVTKCWGLFRKGALPPSDCVPPYGGSTYSCIADPLKGAEARAVGGIIKKCPTCPECYSGGDCVLEANIQVFNTEITFDLFTVLVHCDDSGSPDGLTKDEAKCQDTVAKTLAKFNKSKAKCYDKCVQLEFGGKLPPGSCVPPPTHPKTIECIAKAESKSIAAIDKACFDKPECYGATNGATWTGLGENAVDNAIVDVYCGT